MNWFRSIGGRIAAGPLVLLLLLVVVAGVALRSNTMVREGFGNADRAHKRISAATAATLAGLEVQLQVASYARSETASALAVAREAVAGLDAPLAELAGRVADEDMPPVLAAAAALRAAVGAASEAVLKRRDAGAAAGTVGASLANALTSAQESAARLRAEEPEAIASRLQATVQRATQQILRLLISGNPVEAASAATELDRIAADLAEFGTKSAGVPRLARQLPALEAEARRFAAAIAAVPVADAARTEALERLAGAGAALRASLLPLQRAAEADAHGGMVSLDSQLQDGEQLIQALAGAAAVLGLLAAWRVGRSCARPITALGAAVRGLADGALDAVVPHTGRRDEIGGMARAIGVLRDGALRARSLEEAARTMAETNAAERHAAATRSADATERSLGGVAAAVGDAAGRLRAAADALGASAAEGAARAAEATEGGARTAQNVATVAAAAEQLDASLRDVTARVAAAAGTARAAAESARNTDGIMRGLHDAAHRIEDVVRLIGSVARQTNLLALNATIEAARAGEAGRGFAVVAGEVKALAAQAAAATEEIDRQIEAMRSATRHSVEAIAGIGVTVGGMGKLAEDIAVAVAEQGQATREIAVAASEAARAAAEAADGVAGATRAAAATSASVAAVRSTASAVEAQGEALRGELDRVVQELRAA